MRRTALFPKVVWLPAVLFCTVVYGEAVSKRHPFPFVNVNVVPRDSERIIASQAGLTEDGRIRTIGLADTIPISATTLVARCA